MNVLLAFVKYPRPGQVKTRLSPPLSAQQAKDLYQAMLLDSLEAYHGLEGVELWPQIEPPQDRAAFEALFPHPWKLVDQAGGDLGARLSHAFEHAFAQGAGKVLAVGTDHPSLDPGRFTQALNALKGPEDLVLGPAEDGGYYLIGMTKPNPGLFENVPWSGPQVLETTLEKAQKLGLNVKLLETWYDVDDAPSLDRLENDLKNKENLAPRSLAWLVGRRRSG